MILSDRSKTLLLELILFLFPALVFAQPAKEDSAFIANHYVKMEHMIPMRDGVRLFTAMYVPNDQLEKYPFLMERTPYSCSPYGKKNLPASGLGPNDLLLREKYIFVYQDVRGRYRSEGVFDEMTPALDHKKTKTETDESTDTFDTIEWLLKNVGNNNGKVGIYGISYPGFYASASLPNAHPALLAVSPQAPVSDEFIGDDANHNGAFFLLDNFDFNNYFGGARLDSGTDYAPVFKSSYRDAYAFFKTMEPLSYTNGSKYFNNKAKIWSEYLTHTTYDDYWKARNIRPHLKNVRPAVLVVGGWFDAEDLFGALRTYEAIASQSPANDKVWLVMGPWTHGAWSPPTTHLPFTTYHFSETLNAFYHEQLESKFFNFHLKGKGSFNVPRAIVFETGTNEWKQYDHWPPTQVVPVVFYLNENGTISTGSAPLSPGYDEYISDPSNPVPYTRDISGRRNSGYPVEDQRFVTKRPDVLVYQTAVLTADVTVTGRLKADMFISTTGTDADIVVKLIDVLPPDEPDLQFPAERGRPARTLSLAGVQRLERAEVFRCKFRNSYEKPEPLIPGQVAEVKFDINEIAHTFRKGHRIMIQIQSSWFPLVDLNPQKFVNIPTCSESDFQKATLRLYHGGQHSSSLTLPVLK